MVDGPNITYQPAVAYQGGQVNTPQQDPKSGQTQPVQAPAADTQRESDNGAQHQASPQNGRGQVLDVSA